MSTAALARIMAQWNSSCIPTDNPITKMSGWCAFIWVVASIPFITGILMSMTTMMALEALHDFHDFPPIARLNYGCQVVITLQDTSESFPH